ncbi:TraM recognition domain-containing protein [Agrobacterium sp. DE0009]|uniref:TraM recognition domain-containing protein n=1 Tax=Agrobacterium sp. DE0009 TaxID=2587505 RepID=UPI00119F4277|nr:TraM recognition domain-containing protein [Agrobacterium sp. DE0009]
MARKTIKQCLAELDAQRSALKARLSKTERNNDMRRKVLIGSLVMHHLETSDDQEFSRQLGDWLRRELHQLRAAYGHRAGTFLSNAGVLQVFGVNDHHSARLISDLLG